MSAPNANAPNDGILNKAATSVANAANYAAETVQGKSAEASKEANKEKAKGNTGGGIGDQLTGAKDAISDKASESKHDASASANKQGI
jgi:hypothetical protein